MERVWKLVALRPGCNDGIENPIDAISGKNVLLIQTLSNSGASLERLTESLARFNPKKLKIAVAFQKRPSQ